MKLEIRDSAKEKLKEYNDKDISLGGKGFIVLPVPK